MFEGICPHARDVRQRERILKQARGMSYGSLHLVFHVFIFATLCAIAMKNAAVSTTVSLLFLSQVGSAQQDVSTVDTAWHAPLASDINNLNTVINGTGTYGFIFNSSSLPPGVPYGTYNWCNMPHVRSSSYPRANSSYRLEYVEVIHRHHKRTPYATNTFPVEGIRWECSDEGLFYYGSPLPAGSANGSATPYWSVFSSPANPLAPAGFNGSCQFPQITAGGLEDSRQHGADIAGVYRDLLGGFLPAAYDPRLVAFRVTNNVITSQVAGMVLAGMFPALKGGSVPLLIQQDSVDSLEPAYSCPRASAAYGSFASGSSDPGWLKHLKAAATLYAKLDAISGIDASDGGWHSSFDHYFDTLSARLCHAKPLPCNITNSKQCITQDQANEVFRLGEYEYSYTYRDAGAQALNAAVASFGIWVAELARNIRIATGMVKDETNSSIRYRHNVAHDGSVSRLLAILQLDKMVWPGMGSEVIFEVYSSGGRHETGPGSSQKKAYFVRVLWSGQVMTSSNPSLGRMDMIPVETLLAYFDALVGVNAQKVPALCGR